MLYISILNAGAPAPKDINFLPNAPHTFSNVTNLSVGLEWDKGFINEFIKKSNLYKLSQPISGGVSVFKAKKHKDFSNLNGAYIWVDVIGLDNNKISRLVISGVYGKDNLISDVMALVYKLNVYNGSSKFILINNKASVRTSVRKKNVLNMVFEISDNCTKSSGNYKIFSLSSNNILNKSIIDWESEKVCKAKPKSVVFSGILNGYKINKLLWAEYSEGQKFIMNNINKNK